MKANQLNEQQKKIVNSESNIFVKAGAGTGKTRTIIELYFDLLYAKRYDVKHILAITFTEKAANEMKERIKRKIHEMSDAKENVNIPHLNMLQKRVNYAWISTMHAFCSRVLREFPLQSGIDPMFEVITESEKRKRVKYCVRNYFNQSNGSSRFNKIKELAYLYRYDKLLELFEEALEKKQYEIANVHLSAIKTKTDDVQTGVEIKRLLPDFKKTYNEMLKMYIDENKRDNKLDYDQLLSEVRTLLTKDDTVRETLQKRFKCIIVDEFQDTNKQLKEIVALLNVDNRIVFVGDSKQSIYLFNGADVSVFNNTEKEFKREEIFELFKNYRSNKQLIDFYNHVFPKIFEKKPELDYTVQYDALSAQGECDQKRPVKLLPISKNFHEECTTICKYIKKRIDEGSSYGDFAVLMRRMTHIEVLEEALKHYGIPFFVSGNRGFFKKPEIVSLTSFIKAIYDPADEENLLILLRSFLSPYTDSQLVQLRKMDKTSLLKAWEKYSQQKDDRSGFYNKFVEMRNKSNVMNPERIVQTLIDFFDYEFLVSQLSNPGRRLLNIKKFVEYAQNFEGESSLRSFISRLHGLETNDEGEASTDNEKSDVVRVMTIHKSKGLEFNTVIFPELGYAKQSGFSKPKIIVDYESNNLSFIDPETAAIESEYTKMLEREQKKEDEEEKRVLYVAFTRAEKELILSYSRPSKNKKRACFRNALIKAGLIVENGKEDFWNCDPDAHISTYTEIIKHSDMPKDISNNISDNSNRIISKKEIIIPKSVYDLDEKPWKKYVSPTVLTSNDPKSFFEKKYEDITEYEKDERKNIDRKTAGTLIHKVLEDFGEIPLKAITPQVIRNKISDEPDFEVYLPELISTIRKMTGCKSEILSEIESAETVYSEVPIRKKFGKYVLTGTIDKLFFSNGNWKIVDFKYAQGDKRDINDYIFQIKFYLYCLEKLLEPSPQKGYIYFIKNNETVEINDLVGIEKEISRKIELFNSC